MCFVIVKELCKNPIQVNRGLQVIYVTKLHEYQHKLHQ